MQPCCLWQLLIPGFGCLHGGIRAIQVLSFCTCIRHPAHGYGLCWGHKHPECRFLPVAVVSTCCRLEDPYLPTVSKLPRGSVTVDPLGRLAPRPVSSGSSGEGPLHVLRAWSAGTRHKLGDSPLRFMLEGLTTQENLVVPLSTWPSMVHIVCGLFLVHGMLYTGHLTAVITWHRHNCHWAVAWVTSPPYKPSIIVQAQHPDRCLYQNVQC